MAIRLDLRARDVTQLPDERPAPDSAAAPERAFAIGHGPAGYRLEYDGNTATVPAEEMQNLLDRVGKGTSVEWRHSSDRAMQTTFRPLSRILQCINSTPSYQLFLAGFHVGDAIGLFDLKRLQEPAVADSFRYLVGTLHWSHGRRGRLFFIPDGYVTSGVEQELIGNSKVVAADLFTGDVAPTSHVEHKLFVPYATPLGFNTRVSEETEVAWRQIGDLIRRQGGGPV
jgi:hypothetical protein